MDGLAGFKRIFAFLIMQSALLLAAAAYLAFVAYNHAARPDLGMAAALALGFTACALLVLRFSWSIGASGVELLWGTSVKRHVERWMQPTLSFGAFALIATAIFLLAGDGSWLVSVSELAFAELAIGAPLAISGLLLVSAVRRYRAYRRGLEHMVAQEHDAPVPERVQASIRSEAGQGDTTVRASPQGFTFAGLTSRPWHDARDFPWIGPFEEAVDQITAEFEAIQQRHSSSIHAYKYAGLEGEFWQSFQFVTRHRELAANLPLCPVTAALLRTIPHYPSFRDAMFSILDGGGVIQPHRDVSNVFLTVHLPLIAPGNGYMEVGGLRREWRRGEAMVFDSSYQHQAQNNSDRTRVVLLVDFLHPDLTPEEAAWVTASRL